MLKIILDGSRFIALTIFFSVLVFVPGRANAQNTNTYRPAVFADSERLNKIADAYPLIDSLFRSYADRNHFPGIAYGLLVDGRLVHSGAFGYTDVGAKTPVTAASLFRIASMTKSFTAMAILKLRDENKLHLDDPAYQYIPEMKQLDYLSSDASPITIRNLLNHAAGFPEDNPWGDRQLEDPDQQLMALVDSGISFSHIPGVAYEYSNLGFALLGHIVSKVSGEPYQQYITDNILRPLGMTSTYWEFTKAPAASLAHGYRWINGGWQEQPMLHDGAYGAMGGLITSIEDFSRYVAFHQSVWPPSDLPETGPVKRSSVREMQHPWNFISLDADYSYPGGRTCAMVSEYGYGLGWLEDCEGRVYVGHSGGLPGFGSQWRILPDYGIGIISFANLTYAGMGNINMMVLDTIIRMAGLKPRVLPPSPILQERRDELMQVLPNWFHAKESKIFAVNFFMDNPVDSLRKECEAIFRQAGHIVHVGDVIPENRLRGRFEIEGEKARIGVAFTLTPENPPLIQAFSIRLLDKQ